MTALLRRYLLVALAAFYAFLGSASAQSSIKPDAALLGALQTVIEALNVNVVCQAPEAVAFTGNLNVAGPQAEALILAKGWSFIAYKQLPGIFALVIDPEPAKKDGKALVVGGLVPRGNGNVFIYATCQIVTSAGGGAA